MSYRYEFDATYNGDLRLRRSSYPTLQPAYRLLRDELDAWNRRALDHGAPKPPYEQEVDDLNTPRLAQHLADAFERRDALPVAA